MTMPMKHAWVLKQGTTDTYVCSRDRCGATKTRSNANETCAAMPRLSADGKS